MVDEVRHLGPRPACGAKRVKGMLLSGDPEQVTCQACLDAGKGKGKD